MPTTVRRKTGRWAPRLACALMAAGLATAAAGLSRVAVGQSVTVDIGLQAPNLIAPGQLVGEWLTIVRTGGRPQPVRLTLHQVEPGKTAGKLIYSSPRRCTVDLEYGGPDEDRHIFYMIPFTNCFDYKKTDYVAIWTAEPELKPGEPSDEADRFGLDNYRRAAKDAVDAGDTAPSGTGMAPRVEALDRVRYAVVMNDQQTESGLLTRQ